MEALIIFIISVGGYVECSCECHRVQDWENSRSTLNLCEQWDFLKPSCNAIYLDKIKKLIIYNFQLSASVSLERYSRILPRVAGNDL